MRTRTRAAITALGLVAVTGCGTADGGGAEGPSEAPTAPADDGPQADDPSATSQAVLGEETRQAIENASDVEDVAVEDVLVVTAERVTWPDGALGCPESGRTYTQALVEGYRIVLDVAGTEVTYHGEADQPPFRCDDPQPPVEG